MNHLEPDLQISVTTKAIFELLSQSMSKDKADSFADLTPIFELVTPLVTPHVPSNFS